MKISTIEERVIGPIRSKVNRTRYPYPVSGICHYDNGNNVEIKALNLNRSVVPNEMLEIGKQGKRSVSSFINLNRMVLRTAQKDKSRIKTSERSF